METMKSEEELARYATKHTIVVNEKMRYSVYISDNQKDAYLSKLLTQERKLYPVMQPCTEGWNEKYDMQVGVFPFLWDLLYRDEILMEELRNYVANKPVRRLEHRRENLQSSVLYPQAQLYDGHLTTEQKINYIWSYFELMEVPLKQQPFFQNLKSLLHLSLVIANLNEQCMYLQSTPAISVKTYSLTKSI